MNKIKCNNIEYRKGYIEITPNIHEGFINLETWRIDPDIDLTNIELEDDDFPDKGVTGNTEIELSVIEVEELIQQLQKALSLAKQNECKKQKLLQSRLVSRSR